jgi:hypothetical protein
MRMLELTDTYTEEDLISSQLSVTESVDVQKRLQGQTTIVARLIQQHTTSVIPPIET